REHCLNAYDLTPKIMKLKTLTIISTHAFELIFKLNIVTFFSIKTLPILTQSFLIRSNILTINST
ncbi:hypothetical protein PSYAR_09682, partial [Pseudomonas syringae pv. aceris str. M302273]